MVSSSIEYKKRLAFIEEIFSKEKGYASKCMYPNCSAKAIGSHVFSRAHILQPISNNNSKIYQFYQRPLIFINEDIFSYKLRSIEKAFTFKGFCQYHDTKLFKSIEPQNGFVDWTKRKAQCLISYRTLCREIYANLVMQKVYNKLSLNENVLNYNLDFFMLQKKLAELKVAKVTLDQYKMLLERIIHNNDKKQYKDIYFEYIELPFQFDLFISGPLHVEYTKGLCYNSDYQEINIINVFPYQGKTMIIIGYMTEFDNEWMKQIISKLKSPYPHIVSSAFVDMLYRLEFHAISPSLYYSLDKKLLDAFLQSWKMEFCNFSNDIDEISSLFYAPLNKLMPSTWKNL